LDPFKKVPGWFNHMSVLLYVLSFGGTFVFGQSGTVA
jgi:hypothetical protein